MTFITTIAAFSNQGLGGIGGEPVGQGFVNSNSFNITLVALHVDDTNIYVGGSQGLTSAYISRFQLVNDSTVFSGSVGSGTTLARLTSMVVNNDINANIYAVYYSVSNVSGTNYGTIILKKFSIYGDILGSKTLITDSGSYMSWQNTYITQDSTGYLYATYNTAYAGSTTGLPGARIQKMDNLGTTVWTVTLKPTTTSSVSNYAVSRSVAVDSTNNVYVLYYYTVAGTGGYDSYYNVLVKFSSAGAVIWCKRLNATDRFQSIKIINNTLFLLGSNTGFQTAANDIMQLNTDGTILAQFNFGLQGEFTTDVTKDTAGNYYFTVGNSIIKTDSAFTIIYVRKITNNSVVISISSIQWRNNLLYFTIIGATGAANGLVMKVPEDRIIRKGNYIVGTNNIVMYNSTATKANTTYTLSTETKIVTTLTTTSSSITAGTGTIGLDGNWTNYLI